MKTTASVSACNSTPPQRGKLAQFFIDAKPDDWRTLLAAFSSAYGIGLLAMLVLPFMIGSTMSGLKLDESEAGLLGTAEFIAVMAGSLALAPFMGKIPRRTAAIIGAILAIGGNFASMFLGSFESLLMVRPIVGLGCGLTLAVGNATVASAENSEKLAGQMSILCVTLAAIGMKVFAYVSKTWGYSGVYAALALFMLALAGFIRWLPGHIKAEPQATPEHPHAHKGLLSKASLLMLAVMFIFALRDTMMWAFAERVGLATGYETDELGLLFSLQAVIGIIGPLVASVIGSRLGLRWPVLLGICLTGIVTFTILHSSNAKLPYTIGVLGIGGTYFFTLSYLTALAAELDIEGRVVAASGAFLVAGVATGPALSGFLIVRGGFALSSWVNLLMALLALVLVSVPLASIERTSKRAGSPSIS